MAASNLVPILLASSFLPWSSLATAPKAFSLDFVKGPASDHVKALRRRGSTFSTEIDNLQVIYTANVSIGTPPQYFEVTLDTGSSDPWVPAFNSTICNKDREYCDNYGSYNLYLSSSAEILSTPFNTSYKDNSADLGYKILDTVGFGGISMKTVQVGVVEKASKPIGTPIGPNVQGIMGISFEGEEAAVADGKPEYTNVVGSLVKNGIIGTMAYSLYMDDQAASSGSILFGGVDTKKYEGSLISLPIAGLSNNTIPSLSVQLTSVTLEDESGISTITTDTMHVVLDSGTTVIQLPFPIAEKITNYVGAVDGLVPCSLSTCDAAVTFGLGGKDGAYISVPMSELVESYTGDFYFADGTEACSFGVQGQPASERVVLGDTFLRSAYVVYNLDAKRIGLAQSKWNAGSSSNIVEISSANPIPGAKAEVSLVPMPTASSTGPAPTKAANATQAASASGSASASSSTQTTGTLPFKTKQASYTPRGSAPPELAAYSTAATLASSAAAASATGIAPTGTGVMTYNASVPFTGAAGPRLSSTKSVAGGLSVVALAMILFVHL